MGICSSCLGHRSSSPDPSRAALLSPTAPTGREGAQYSTFYPPSPLAVAIDPSQQLHEREYLDRLVAQTSEHLIDIFAPPVLAMSVTPSSRGEWYRSLLEREEVVVGGEGSGGKGMVEVRDAAEVGSDERKWLESLLGKGEEAVKEVATVKSVGRLVVGLEMD